MKEGLLRSRTRVLLCSCLWEKGVQKRLRLPCCVAQLSASLLRQAQPYEASEPGEQLIFAESCAAVVRLRLWALADQRFLNLLQVAPRRRREQQRQRWKGK